MRKEKFFPELEGYVERALRVNSISKELGLDGATSELCKGRKIYTFTVLEYVPHIEVCISCEDVGSDYYKVSYEDGSIEYMDSQGWDD